MVQRVVPGVIAACLLAGCFVPPTRLSGGTGAATGGVLLRSPRGDEKVVSSVALHELRIVTTWSSLPRGAISRRLDLGVGWTLDWFAPRDGDERFRHGPAFEMGWFVRPVPEERQFGWRWGPTSTVEILFEDARARPASFEDPGASYGFGAAIGARIEYVAAMRGDGSAAPLRYTGTLGDVGAGLSARAGLRHVDRETYRFFILALDVAFPGIIGIPVP